MFFTIIDRNQVIPAQAMSCAFLRIDRWDDWGKYQTQFYLTVCDVDGGRFDIGSVKIGQKGLLPGSAVAPNTRTPELLRQFDALDARFFSLGQSETYYESLNQLSESLRTRILEGLRDVAYDLTLYRSAEDEDVMNESLMRDISSTNVVNRFHRLANGNAVT